MSSTLRYDAELLEKLKNINYRCKLAKQSAKKEIECATCVEVTVNKKQKIDSTLSSKVAWWDDPSVTLNDYYNDNATQISQPQEQSVAYENQQQQPQSTTSILNEVIVETIKNDLQ